MSWLEQRREVQLALNAALAVRSPRSSAERLHFLGQFLLDWHGGKRPAGTAAVISSSQPAASATELAELELAIKRALTMAKRNTSERAIVVVARHLLAKAELRPADAAALAPGLPGAALKPVPLPDCEESIGFVSYSEGWSEHWPFVSYGEGAFDTRSPELKAAWPLIKCVAAPIAASSSSSSSSNIGSSSSSNGSSSAAPHERVASPRGKRAPSPRGPKGGAAAAAAAATSHAAKGHVSARQQLPAIDIAAAHLAADTASDAQLRPPPADDVATPGTELIIKGKYGEVHDVQLSKLMSKLLRHKAKEYDVPIDTDGWVLLTDAIAHVNRREAELALESEPPREPCTWTEEHVHAMVGLNDKQRFELREQPTAGGVYQIRAAQGHSMKQVGEQIGTLITFDSETKEASVPFAVHGTTITALRQILAQGLHKMERHHIHLAKGLLGEEAVISGMRHDCAVYIWVDISSALEHGIRFFESTNGVILCEGDENGYLPPRFFSSVIELRGVLAQPNYVKQPLVMLLERLFPAVRT
jgi:2'-phosphotransferase